MFEYFPNNYVWNLAVNIATPPHMKGIERFACHVETGFDVLLAGTRFAPPRYALVTSGE